MDWPFTAQIQAIAAKDADGLVAELRIGRSRFFRGTHRMWRWAGRFARRR